MSLKRPFAYNTGSTINGTVQYGYLAVGFDSQTYANNIGGVKWWMGPDESRGYIIAKPIHDGTQPNPINIEAKVAFSRSLDLTEESFITLLNRLNFTGHTFTDGIEGKNWLEANGYWTSYTQTGSQPQPPNTPTPSETPCFEYLVDDNGNYMTDNNGNLIVLKELCVSPTPTSTVTPTVTPTNTTTPTPTVTPSITPSVTSSPIPVTGYGYNLVATPYQIPTSGNTIISNDNGGGVSGSTDPNSFNVGPGIQGIYWNKIDKDGVDRDSYYSSFVGNCVRMTISQNGSTAIYDGTLEDVQGTGAPYGGWIGSTQDTGYYFRGNGGSQVQLVQSATTQWVIGDTVYISLQIIPCPTPTPTPSTNINSVNTIFIHVPN